MREKYRQAREEMIENQLKRRGIDDGKILEAFRQVPRHEFVPEKNRHKAYRDHPLPIGEEQTISQPYIVAYMMEKIKPEGDNRLLEVGSGCGYVLALLAEIAAEVYGVERRSSLVEMSRKNLKDLGYDLEIKHGDGTRGWSEKSPFDGIIVSAAAGKIPDHLKKQLAIGGRMIIPISRKVFQQQLVLVKRTGGGRYDTRKLNPVRFVPLLEGKE
ncbi:protein-L-isoaspartate(D-aspartate) O-methyltransferase [Halarsenatibacter silvermanii]|uniref:Protein-L-isoaspartate O-methyltransferase n=1 Tax=Halarsenatibacter silvermanii TaxID=321763 RepID=A0A1G9H0X2_9FIRM|nr:protein-L-isoaspartate(D-aspartate) O-methyltransferase [Halarsenatibacter silvermanii]